MRVLFLNNFYYLRGGSERVLFEEMRMLREAGCEVAIFSRANRMNESSEYHDFFPPEIDFEIRGVSVEKLKIVKEVIYSGEAKKNLKRLIATFRPDIAHAHNIYGRLSFSVVDALREEKVPLVLTLHDYKILCPSYLMLNHDITCERCRGRKFFNAVLTRCHKNSILSSAVYAFESWFSHASGKYEAVNKFISPSRFLRQKAVEFGWSPDRLTFIPNCVDTEKILPNNQGGSYLLYFGRLSREKGIGTLIKAVAGLRVCPALMIVGEGPESQRLQELSARQRLPVTFTGFLNGIQLEEKIAGAAAVVVPSESYENAPLSILEAFAHGKPVIGARIGGIPEMIEEGITGLLFQSGNADDLRKKVEYFFSLSDVEVLRMSYAARQRVESEYGRERHYQQLMVVYQDAIRESGTGCASPI